MYSRKANFITLILAILMCVSTYAQKDRYQMYVVHEDHVIDGMMDKHHQGDKNLADVAKREKMKGMDWITFVSDDNRVMYLSPIDNMADLDKNPFENLEKKLGKEAYDDLFDAYDGTYSKHGDYILRLDKELSYMPGGITQTPAGQDYRELIFYHIPPGGAEKAEELARYVKKMYEDNNSKIHYRLYKSGFGNMGNYYMVAVAAKDAADLEKRREENMSMLGDKGEALRDKIESTFSDIERVTGHLKPELSYVQN